MESHHPDGDLRPNGSADCLGHHELHENAVDVKCKMYVKRGGLHRWQPSPFSLVYPISLTACPMA